MSQQSYWRLKACKLELGHVLPVLALLALALTDSMDVVVAIVGVASVTEVMDVVVAIVGVASVTEVCLAGIKMNHSSHTCVIM